MIAMGIIACVIINPLFKKRSQPDENCLGMVWLHKYHAQLMLHISIQWSLCMNKGHFGSIDFVLYLEAVLSWEVRITIVCTRVIPIGDVASVLYTEVVLWWEGPL